MRSVASKKLRVSIKTFGCQMNRYDAEVAAGVLAHAGYELAREEDDMPAAAAPAFTRADIVLMNTCSVREHAEDRVYGRLRMLAKAKERRPDMIVGLMGCMVEEHRERLFERFPHLDLMVGTRNIKELPALLERVLRERRQVARIKQDGISIEYTDKIKRDSAYHAWLPVMTGCDKVCTFCIVPVTRGREVSMPPREVYREACRLVREGVKWITLLGQNVNSYAGSDHGKKVSFPELLAMLCRIEGCERISFTTSHPHDATRELFEVIRDHPKISRLFHLPLQSGSDTILKRMKRQHTFEQYKRKIDLMRALIPGIAITTDIMVGFSGETDREHSATRRAMEEIRFDGAFIYKYSLRPGTPAARLADDVPMAVKERRNAELLELQKRISGEKNRSWIGRTIEVFAEDISAKDPGRLLGRSAQEKKVVFPGGANELGKFHSVYLDELRHETLIGRRLDG